MAFVDNALVAHRNHVAALLHQRLERKGEVTMFLDAIRRVFVKIQILSYGKEGASGIEYAIVAAMCAAVIGIFMSPISTKVTSIFNSIKSGIGT
jgi:pilus assembly protein Flp/PilA